MFIAHVHFTVAPENRTRALKALLSEVPQVSQMPGCLYFMPFLDPTNDEDLGVIHEWKSEADFIAYAASDAFNAMSKALRPMMITAPASRRFNVVEKKDVD